jgi:hypothetical protein
MVEEMKPINQANEIFKFKIYYWTKKFQKQINISKYNKWLKNGRPVYEIPINNINSKVEELLSSRINTYDFENDECFQNGISTLKDRFKDNEEHLNIALNNAKVFYLKKLIQSELAASASNSNANNKDEEKNQTEEIVSNINEQPTSSNIIKENKENTKEESNDNENNNNTEVTDTTTQNEISPINEGESGEDKPKYPKSFYEICEMIAKNQPIPGIRQIPNKINEGTPSKPSMKPRPKPWELKRMQYEKENNIPSTINNTNDENQNNNTVARITKDENPSFDNNNDNKIEITSMANSTDSKDNNIKPISE